MPLAEHGHLTSINVCPVPWEHRPINRGHVGCILVKEIHLNNREGACQDEPDEAPPPFYNPAWCPQYSGPSVSPRHEACAIPTQTPGRSKREPAKSCATMRPGLKAPKGLTSRGHGAQLCGYSMLTRTQVFIGSFQAEKASISSNQINQALTKEGRRTRSILTRFYWCVLVLGSKVSLSCVYLDCSYLSE